MLHDNLTREKLGIHIQPLGYRVLIKAPDISEKSLGGIIIPHEVREDDAKHFAVGQVLAFGESAFSKEAQSFQVNIGEWVQYSKYEREAFFIKKGGYLCYYVNDDRLLGIVDKKDLITLGIDCNE